MTDDRRGPRALDVDTDADLTRRPDDAYRESDDHRPDPLAMYGTLDTSDTAGGAHQDIRYTSPAFAEGRAEALRTAARALDPDDPTPSELVVLPEGSVTVTGTAKTADDARGDIERAFTDLAENPVPIGVSDPLAAESRDEDERDPRRDPRPEGSVNPVSNTDARGNTGAETRTTTGTTARKNTKG